MATVVIKPPERVNLGVVLVGDSPLLVNKFGLTNQGDMVHHAETGGQTREKGPRDLAEEYQESLYKLPDQYGFPCAGIRNSMKDACRGIRLSMAEAKQIFWVPGAGYDIETRQALCPLYGEPYAYNAFPSKGNGGGRSLVVTGRYDEWVILASIRWAIGSIDSSSVVNLLARAGLMVGIGYFRLQKGGEYGAFHVADEGEKEALGFAHWA